MALEICILISVKKTLHNVSRAYFLSMSMLSVALKTDVVVGCCGGFKFRIKLLYY